MKTKNNKLNFVITFENRPSNVLIEDGELKFHPTKINLGDPSIQYVQFHLISNDPIELGDCFVLKDHKLNKGLDLEIDIDGGVFQRLFDQNNPEELDGWINGVGLEKGESGKKYQTNCLKKHCRKIEATTDNKLIEKGLSEIPEYIVKQIIKTYNVNINTLKENGKLFNKINVSLNLVNNCYESF